MAAPHLVRRFTRSLSRRPPGAADVEWVRSLLTPGEFALWSRLPNQDRSHSVRVARRTEAALASTPWAGDRVWLDAALMHDVGKYDAGLGLYGRVAATLCGAVGGPGMPDAWSGRGGFTRRVGLYLRHGEIGADMIRLAGGPEQSAVWAAAHHHPDTWAGLGLDPQLARALDAADHE
ncbi:MAG: hypothetical protein JWL73_2345 [Actinomycetia bacterium]|nr:hypothetical protein [Actinomycetes bacterium]